MASMDTWKLTTCLVIILTIHAEYTTPMRLSIDKDPLSTRKDFDPISRATTTTQKPQRGHLSATDDEDHISEAPSTYKPVSVPGETADADLGTTPGSENCIPDLDPCDEEAAIVSEEGMLCFTLDGTSYPRNAECAWKISAPTGFYLHVEFTFLDIECCSMCACDNLTVFDGLDNSGLELTTMCGSTLKKVSNDYYGYGHLYLQFQSDEDLEATGFKANIRFIENPSASVAFEAGRITLYETDYHNVQLIFNEVNLNVGGGFDLEANHFKTPMTGMYYFNLAAGVIPGRHVHLTLRKNGQAVVVLERLTKDHTDIDMTSRSVLLQLNKDDIIDVWMHNFTALFSDFGLQTSLIGFKLPHMYQYDAATFVGSNRKVLECTDCYVDVLDQRLVVSGDWGKSTDKIVAPVSGVYFVEFSIASKLDSFAYLHGDQSHISGLQISRYPEDGYGMVAGGLLTPVEKGEALQIQTQKGELLSDDGLQVSIMAYLMSTDTRPRPLLSVYRSSADTAINRMIPFDIVMANVSALYDTSTGIFKCTFPGIYFVYVQLGAYTSSFDTVAHVRKNDAVIGVLSRLNRAQYFDDLSKGMLTRLIWGDEIGVELKQGRVTSSLTNRRTILSLVLLDNLDPVTTNSLSPNYREIYGPNKAFSKKIVKKHFSHHDIVD